MSFKNCLIKAGVSDEVKESITALVKKHIKDGMTPEQKLVAENKIIEEYIKSIDTDLDGIAARAKEAGAEIKEEEYVDPKTTRERELQERERVFGSKGILSESIRESVQNERRESDGSLKGLPREVGDFVASINIAVTNVATKYMESIGQEYKPVNKYAAINEERATRIADEFEEAVHDPQNPEVKAAYRAMINETRQQYDAIIASGLKVEYIVGEDPYIGNPRRLMEDVRNNNHLWVFSTRDGFGSDAEFDPVDNPLLEDTGLTISGKPALANDLFRVVHDYFGHVKEGVGFRATGEENAWRSHASMYSPLARRAMTTETRGQNSWVNFGPYAEKNKTATAADTVYSDQKITLLPEWASEDGRIDGVRQLRRDSDVRMKFQEYLDRNPEEALNRYVNDPESQNGRVIGGDIAKELSADFRKDRTLAPQVHLVALKWVKARYRLLLSQKPTGQQRNFVLFTAGGAGAGKTSALNRVLNTAKYQIVYDTNMKNFESGKTKINLALDAGKKVHIAMIYRDVLEALKNGALSRAAQQEKELGSGRILQIDNYLLTHKGAVSTLPKLVEHYKGNENVIFTVIDNSRGKDQATVTTVDFLAKIRYDGVEVKLRKILEEEYNDNKISKKIYEGFKRTERVQEARERDRAKDGRRAEQARDSYTTLIPKIFRQPDIESFRGEIGLTDESAIIKLHSASDLSTFLHESAHLFLNFEAVLADELGVTDDQQTILDFLGVESFTDIGLEQHEKFAETFELYLKEGKAPSNALRDAFAAFKQWLLRIYQAINDPRLGRADLTPDITEVFDRLLATESEIERATSNPAYEQFFKSKEQAGMTDVQWLAYLKKVEQAKNRSQESIDTKLLKELNRRKTKEWNEEKAPLIEEEKERLGKEPVYQILTDLNTIPLNYEQVVEIMGKLPGRLIGKAKKDGVAVEEYSELYGYFSPQAMLRDITEKPTLKAAADTAAEARMVAKYGDILNDGSIEAEVQESIHNEAQAALLLTELRALKPTRTRIDTKYLQREAKKLISTMKYKEIQPGKYYRAEINAAKKSVSDPDNAFQHKIQQLANHYMYKEAVKVREQMLKQRKYVRSLEVKQYPPKTVHPSYAQNIRMLARSYNMRQGDSRRKVNVEKIINWMITQIEDENQYIDFNIYDPTLLKAIQDQQMGLPVDYQLPEFNDLTAAELKGLSDQLRHMRFVGGKLSESARDELNVSRETSAASIKKNAHTKIPPSHEESIKQRAKDKFQAFGFSHRRIGGIFETLDGFKEDQPMGEEYEKITAASNKELTLTNDMAAAMDEAFKGVLALINRRKSTTIVKEDGLEFTLSHRARFVLGLNWGNAGNKEAVLTGLNNKFPDDYTERDITKMLSTMSDLELNSLNKVWAAKEALWPEMSGVEVRIKGVAPVKVAATPITINGIKLTGGHYRLHYRKDPNDSVRSSIALDKAGGDRIKLSTASSLYERVGSGGRQVDLELGHLFQDVHEDIHYIAYAELAEHLNAMFKGINNPVVSSIQIGYGQPYYDNLINTLSAITQSEDPAKGLWKFLKIVRTNLTYAFLAGSFRNIIQQPIAVTNAAAQLGEKYLLKGFMEYYRHPIQNWEKISKSSPFMRNRTALVNREAREQLMKMDALHPAIGKMKSLAFMPQTFMDSLIAYPTWMGALNKYKDEHPNATEAKAKAYADEMVAKTIGSGLPKDVGSILNKSEAEKQITFMGTFFNLTWNLHVENAQLLKRGKISGMEYARRLGWMAVAPALLGMWLLDDIPEDDDEIIPHALKEIAFYNMSSMFLLRDLASAFDGFDPSIPGLKFADGIVRVTSEMQGLIVGDEELDAETVASILRGLQPLVPIPASGQIARTLEGLADPKQDLYGALVEGKERNK